MKELKIYLIFQIKFSRKNFLKERENIMEDNTANGFSVYNNKVFSGR
jgi:hypothetical protein